MDSTFPNYKQVANPVKWYLMVMLSFAERPYTEKVKKKICISSYMNVLLAKPFITSSNQIVFVFPSYLDFSYSE